jgi:outer membrane lipoprotein-sorting protein
MDVDVTTEITIDRRRWEVAQYEFSEVGGEATRMTLRNAGTPGGFAMYR